jgi:hypothetical protein
MVFFPFHAEPRQIDDPVIKGGVALFFSYWAFYIHRNDIGFQITLEKRVLLVWLFCLLVSTFLLTILSVKRKSNYIE